MPLATYQIQTGRQDIAPAVSLLAERETPILARVLRSTMAATAVKHEWVNRVLRGFKTTLGAAIADGVTTSITVASTLTHNVGEMLLIDQEYLLVTAVSGVNLTVTRGYAGSTAAAHSNGARIDVVSRPELEGADANTEDQEVGTPDYNYTQIFERVVKLTGTAQAIDVVGPDGSLDAHAQEKTTELLKELERAFMLGARVGPGGASQRRSLGGLRSFVTGVDKAGAGLTTDMIDAAVYDLLEIGGNPNAIIASTVQKRVINGFKNSKVRQTQAERTVGDLVDVYESEAGNLQVIRSNDLPPGELMIVDLGRCLVVPLQGRGFGMERLAKTGDSDNVQILGEYTAELRNPEAHTRFFGLATA